MWSIKELCRELNTEEKCINFLQEHGILHRQRKCKNNHEMKLCLGKPIRWRCRKSCCQQSICIRKNTWLFPSKIPLLDIILFIYSWANEMTSINWCIRELQLCRVTTVAWNSYMREVCFEKLSSLTHQIGGNNCTVEIDESLFVRRKRRKYNKGQTLQQQWVFGGICHETTEVFLKLVPDRSAKTLVPLISQHIAPGSTIISDEWREYKALFNEAFTHSTVNHQYNFIDPNKSARNQIVERLWKSAKERSKRQYGTHTQMLESYLCEFLWRHYTDLNHKDPFVEILSNIAEFFPPS